jgi:outer membrane lipoprotein SlyB
LNLGEDAARVRQALARDSNFDVAEDLIREFAGQAFANHVRAILDRISDAYREQGVVYSERIHLLKSKVTRPPEDFTSEIQELKVLLARYQEILGSFSWTVRDQFAGLSETNELFAQIQKRFTNALNNALTIDELRKHLIDFNKECGDRLNERITALRVQYECKMEEVGQAYQAKHAITAPKIRMDAIAKQAEERAYDVITIPGDRKIRAAKGGVIGGILGGIGGFLLGGPIGAALGAALVGGATAGGEYLDGSPDRTQKIRNERKHFEAFRDGCIDDVAWLTDAMVLAVGSSADAYAKEFNAKMSVVVEQRTDAYDLLISQRSEAEVLREEIRFLETHDESTGRERIAIKDLTATL